MLLRFPSSTPFSVSSCSLTTSILLQNFSVRRLTFVSSTMKFLVSGKRCVKFVRTSCRISVPGTSSPNEGKAPTNYLRDKKIVPDADPPSTRDVNLLYQFLDQSSKLMVLTGAGVSTDCGIPDYRSPNGAYSSGFRPITHQVI